MAGRQRDPRTGRYTSGSAAGSEEGRTEGTSIVDVRTSQRMSRNPSAQSSRRNSPQPSTRNFRRRLEWIMEDIRPRIQWKDEDPEVRGIILEELPEPQQLEWATVQSVYLEEKTSGQEGRRIEEYRGEIDAHYATMLKEREKQREEMHEEIDTQKRLGKMTAKEVQSIKAAMESFITNELSSHLAKAIEHHFRAFPISTNIGQYFQENPISSIPPPHEQDTWKQAIENIVAQHIQTIPVPPKTDEIVAQVIQNRRNELSTWKIEIMQSFPKTLYSDEIQRRINMAVAGIPGPSSQGISEDKCNRMIRAALAARIIPTVQGLTEEQVQERIKAALEAQPTRTGITEAQVEERIKAALEAAAIESRQTQTGLTNE